ncbi:MAG: hypothetical protein ACYTEI_12165 [Planctomycetota bacterium]
MALLAVLGAVCGGGCAKQHPPAVVSNRVLAPGEEDQKAILTGADQSEALAAMQAGTGRPPRDAERPGPAPRGVRWSDIPDAVSEACDELGVEMAVVRETEEPDRFVFELRTIEGWPVRLVIRRGVSGGVYEIEELGVGHFPDDPERVRRGEALVKAFQKHLKRLGAQDWFND